MLSVLSIQLYYFLEALIDSINDAVESAIRDSVEEPLIFIPSSIDVGIRCSLEYTDDSNGIYVTPSNAFVANYYGKGSDAVIQVKISPVPRPFRILVSSGTGLSIDMQDR